ncbi:MAG: hypothetical protein E7120_08005 [Bacteroidales bacterium]|nr:hypothetical protein [Bacteroidales bacterium]
MKNIILLSAAIFLFCAAASAQEPVIFNNQSYGYDQAQTYAQQPVSPMLPLDMKYKELKKIYNYRMYVPTLYDRHSPAWSGVASFFIPGLGQMVNGSVGRGFAWLGGSVACSIASGVAMEAGADGLVLAIGAGALALNICSIVDAVRVAKVKNMYEADLRRQGYVYDVDLYPSVNYVRTGSGLKPTAGMTLALKF